MESAVESPAIALFNPPSHSRPSLLRPSPRSFATRSLQNLRQGNVTLFIVFCGCFIIFARALFGVGYDEGSSAHADAASAKHPSLLSRWGSSQHAIEQQWKKLRERRSTEGQGLWAKIRKEDESTTTTTKSHVPGAEALHWLRAMEDRALQGFGRKPRQQTQDTAHDQGGAPVWIATPEHDISEDLDDHDAHDEEEAKVPRQFGRPERDAALGHRVAPQQQEAQAALPQDPPATSSPQQPEVSAPPPVAALPSDPATPLPSSVQQDVQESQQPTPAAGTHHDDTSEEDPDDQPVYHRDEHR